MLGLVTEAHQSSSHEQQAIEAAILERLSADLGAIITPRTLSLPEGARVDVDGCCDDPPILVEVFAHHGVMKGGQLHKVSTDALKLITIAKNRPGTRLILAFADEIAAKSVQRRSWRTEALRTWGIEVRVVEVDDAQRDLVRAAQLRQRMINPDQ